MDGKPLFKSPTQYRDADFGLVLVQPNTRARRFIFRVKEGQLVVTSPAMASLSEVKEAVDGMRTQIAGLMEKVQAKEARRVVTPDFRIETPDFTFHSEEARVLHMTATQRRGSLTCYYPAGTDFTDDSVQRWLVGVIEESLRQHARVLFAPRLQELARRRGLTYKSMSIHKTHGRWGSCSTRGSINLSLYLMLIPRHLQEHVMQHELTHLKEMNHGPRFHALLDAAEGGRAEANEAELKHYHTDIFTLR